MKSFSGQTLYKKAKKMIPGGTQLLSKRPEMFAPDIWPAYYSSSKGCRVWDLDNNEYIDMSIMAVGACILGYADEDVDKKVIEAIHKGVNNTLNSPAEVALAEKMLELHPWFDMVRYARSGGEAMSIAVRIARAKTRKEKVLFSGYHGWTDWYLSANLANESELDSQLMPGLDPAGVPQGLKGTAESFEFDNINDLKKVIAKESANIAAIVIEPARGYEPSKEYLQELKSISKEIGAILIFDEITSGFRMCPGGIHRRLGVNPDIAVFAKSLANGYPMSVIIGTEEVMQAAQNTFISSTNWTDAIGPSAALATMEKYINSKVDKHIIEIGDTVKRVWKKNAEKFNIDISISGLPSLASFSFNGPFVNELNSKFVIEMLNLGFLGFRQFKPSLAHTHDEIIKYDNAISYVFEKISNLNESEIKKIKAAHDGFHRLTKE